MADISYITVADLRDEGLAGDATTGPYTDAWLAARILVASRFIEKATRRRFVAEDKVVRVDGRGGRMILLSEAIVNVTQVTFDISPFSPQALVLEPDMYRIYNRHLSMNLQEPDDRLNPKIEIYYPVDQYHHRRVSGNRFVFPYGQQNVEVTGTFGFTDYDPDEVVVGFRRGKTPDLIKHVCKLIVMRELVKMGTPAQRNEATQRFRILSERTRDQAYTLEALGTRRGAFFSGDPEIDTILAAYQRPPALGAT